MNVKPVCKKSESEPAWSGLFPKGDFEWVLRMRHADPTAFFKPSDASGDLLKEKTKLLETDPERYLAELPEAKPLQAGLLELLEEWGIRLPSDANDFGTLSRRIEPDLLLMELFHGSTKEL